MTRVVPVLVFLLLPLGIVGLLGLTVVYAIRYNKLAAQAMNASQAEAQEITRRFNLRHTLALVLLSIGSAVSAAVLARVLVLSCSILSLFLVSTGLVGLFCSHWRRYVETRRLVVP